MLTRIIYADKIRHAIERARRLSRSGVILVVKADAYGAGLEIAELVADSCDGFAVARAAEGARLRSLGITKEILVLSFDETQAKLAADYALTPSISNARQLDAFRAFGGSECHVAADTGMNRHGVKTSGELEIIAKSAKTVKISGLFTHIYNNGADNALNQAQKFDLFKSCLQELTGGGFVTHVSASGALETLAGRYDRVRLGIAAYRDANYLISNVIGVKKVYKGESVGYDGAFVAESDMTAAIIEGGYADGIPRRFTGHEILINGDFCRVIGNICMDVLTADVTGKDVKAGDRVIFIDNDAITLKEFSANSGRIEYETLTALKGRCNRIIFA